MPTVGRKVFDSSGDAFISLVNVLLNGNSAKDRGLDERFGGTHLRLSCPTL